MSLLFAGRLWAAPLPPLPPVSENAPELLVLVMCGMPGSDLVNVTYPGVPSAPELQNDLNSLASALNIDAGQAHISSKALPMAGVSTPPMTSVTLPVPPGSELTTGQLPVGQLIVGLRSYRRLDITYIMPPSFHYQGFRRYNDQNVNVLLTQSGSTYVYAVTIRNPNFSNLPLPGTEGAVAIRNRAAGSAGNKEWLLLRVGGLILVTICAGLVGWGVYTALTKLQ